MKQAETLLDLSLRSLDGFSELTTLAVTSGKGGTGKTNVVVNLGLSLAKYGLKIAILDADYGLGNIDILLGIEPKHDIFDVLNGKLRLKDILVQHKNLLIIPASSGVQSLSDLTEAQEQKLQSELALMKNEVDLLIIDTSAGISNNVISLLLSADEVLMVVSTEPTSVIDAYAVVKILTGLDQYKKVRVLINMASTEDESDEIFQKLSKASHNFLNKELEYQGFIIRDKNVVNAVKRQTPIVTLYPQSSSCKNFSDVAKDIYKTLLRNKQ